MSVANPIRTKEKKEMELNRVCGGGIGESNSGAAVVGFHDPVPQRALTENIQMKGKIKKKK